MTNNKYPWQNRQLQDLKGEVWKDIPGLEGYFMISNYGRVRRHEYEVEFRDGRVYTKEQMIMKPTLAKSPNHFKKDHVFFLNISLTLAGTVYHYSIGRLMYHCFIAPIDLGNKKLLVACRNGDGGNVRLSNLVLTNYSERQARVMATQRHENVLLRPEVRKLTNISNRERLGKQVSQYSKKGKRIAIFGSTAEAGEKTGINKQGIARAASGRKLTAGGYYWRYGRSETIDLEAYLEKRKMGYKPGLRKIISQYNMKGKRIAIYNSIQAAGRATGISPTHIGAVVNGKHKSAGGFFWKKGKGSQDINLENYSYGIDSRAKLKRKKVRQYSMKGKLLASFNSIAEAAFAMGKSPGGIVNACKGSQKTCGGFKWAYVGRVS